jgi:hypothetical protein
VTDVKATERRKLAGDIVSDEIAYQGKTQEWAAERMGIAPSTRPRVIDWEAGVTQLRLRAVEGALGLPRHLLTYVIDGDAERIRAIGDEEISPGLRRVILDGLTRVETDEIEIAKGFIAAS